MQVQITGPNLIRYRSATKPLCAALRTTPAFGRTRNPASYA